MDVFDFLNLFGGVSLFLFGMQLMGNGLEKKAGGQLNGILSAMTKSSFKGFFLGMAVTAVIQSSSATTVMVVGFVNSRILTLKQAIHIIMGANIGTTVTSWILSLTGISGDAWYIQAMKPEAFVPVMAMIGIVMFLFIKDKSKKDTGLILLSFATLMTGMDIMSTSVAGLKDVPEFTNILTFFTNPVSGLLLGALLTAVIQSSSASVGILQALSATGAITLGSAVPVIMGQNIGTCVTAMISSIGTNKNARRAAFVHLYFNVIGAIVWLGVFVAIKNMPGMGALDRIKTDSFDIAALHTIFNVLCTFVWLPFTSLLERLAIITVPDAKIITKDI